MWGESLYVATYLLNRSPTTDDKKTPITKWEQRKPDLSRLQIFGSEAYAKRLEPIKKLEAKK